MPLCFNECRTIYSSYITHVVLLHVFKVNLTINVVIGVSRNNLLVLLCSSQFVALSLVMEPMEKLVPLFETVPRHRFAH